MVHQPLHMMHLSPLRRAAATNRTSASSKPLPHMSYVMSSMSLPQKSSPALLGTMKTFIFSNHPFFFALPFFLLVPNLDANHPLSLTLLRHPLTVLTPNSFQSSFNLLPHLLFPSSISRTILFHERSSSPLLAQLATHCSFLLRIHDWIDSKPSIFSNWLSVNLLSSALLTTSPTSLLIRYPFLPTRAFISVSLIVHTSLLYKSTE